MLRLIRTANAGVLLELDGKKLLLDGVCREVYPYPATPESVKQTIQASYPDLVAVTHCHEDHCDPVFQAQYTRSTGRAVLSPADAGKTVTCGGISVTAIASRHIGKADCKHVSYLIQGSQCVLFTGDASPNGWKNRPELPKVDVLICPYAYATTPSAWQISRQITDQAVVLLHLPEPEKDCFGLWDGVKNTVGDNPGVQLFIPAMEAFVKMDF